MEQVIIIVVCLNACLLTFLLLGLVYEIRVGRQILNRLSRVEQLEGEKERLDYERAALARALDVKEEASPPGADPDRGRLGDMQNKALTLWNQERATSVSDTSTTRDVLGHLPSHTVTLDKSLEAPSIASVQSSACMLTMREAAAQDITRAPPPPKAMEDTKLPLFLRVPKATKQPFVSSTSSLPGRLGFLV